MTSADTLPKTAAKATKLIAAAERQTLDPFVEVDWSIPIDDSAFHLPPEFLPLYRTPQWEAMTPVERFAYSRHEAASLCGAGIWFENLLMQLLLQHLTLIDATDPAHRFLLIEIADECRHSAMFGEYIRLAGTPCYRPSLDAAIVSAVEQGPAGRALGYLLILAVEELLDVCNRATMKDDRIHPVARRIAKIHVLEEARHVSFARTYLEEVWPTLDEADRVPAAEFAPIAVSVMAGLIVNPDVSDTLGLTGGYEAAMASPDHQRRMVTSLSGLTEFLSHIGVITDATRPLWESAGLIGMAATSADG